MKKLPAIDQEFLLTTLTDLLSTPSPTGFTDNAVAYIEEKLQDFPALSFHRTIKGAVVADWAGDLKTSPKVTT